MKCAYKNILSVFVGVLLVALVLEAVKVFAYLCRTIYLTTLDMYDINGLFIVVPFVLLTIFAILVTYIVLDLIDNNNKLKVLKLIISIVAIAMIGIAAILALVAGYIYMDEFHRNHLTYSLGDYETLSSCNVSFITISFILSVIGLIKSIAMKKTKKEEENKELVS